MARPSISSDDATSTWPLWCRWPPSDFGRITNGRSSTEQGGKARPSGAGVRPVAFDTAVLSIAGLEPSRKLLNILGFRPPRLACSSLRPQYFQTVSGVDCAKCGSHLWPRPAAGTETPEARGHADHL